MFRLPWRHDPARDNATDVFAVFARVIVSEQFERGRTAGTMAGGALLKKDRGHIFGECYRAAELNGVFNWDFSFLRKFENRNARRNDDRDQKPNRFCFLRN